MTRNWNIIWARLADPFDPDWECVQKQVEAMIADQDARGDHVYPPFRLPDSQPSTPSGPVAYGFLPSDRPLPTHASSTEVDTAPAAPKLKASDPLESPPYQPRRVVASRDHPTSPASKLNNALTASKRAAFGRVKGGVLHRNTPVSYKDETCPSWSSPSAAQGEMRAALTLTNSVVTRLSAGLVLTVG